LTPILFIGVMMLLVWVLLIAPQRRRQQAQRRMMEEVHVGDDVLTAGGMYATVREVRDDDLTVEIAPEINIRLDKRAVALVLSGDDEDEEYDEEPAALEPAAEHEVAPDEEPSQAGRT
jgi:preprotein translocase subunit YajC